MPMDFDARERERLEMAQRRPATAQEIASHLPRWAQELMLDPDASEEYEEAQVTARAAELHASRVADRTWEEDGEGGRPVATAAGAEGSSAGAGSSTR